MVWNIFVKKNSQIWTITKFCFCICASVFRVRFWNCCDFGIVAILELLRFCHFVSTNETYEFACKRLSYIIVTTHNIKNKILFEIGKIWTRIIVTACALVNLSSCHYTNFGDCSLQSGPKFCLTDFILYFFKFSGMLSIKFRRTVRGMRFKSRQNFIWIWRSTQSSFHFMATFIDLREFVEVGLALQSVRPDWATFESSWQQYFLQK